MPKTKIILRLPKRKWKGWTVKDHYKAIKYGRKHRIHRKYTPYWTKRLLINEPPPGTNILTPKTNRIWLTVGFPEGNLPRLEADITRITLLHPLKYEIQFENVVEVRE